MGQELIGNGSFEDITPAIFLEDTDGDGNVTAPGESTPGQIHTDRDAKTGIKTYKKEQPPPGWIALQPIRWMSNANKRDRSYPFGAYDGDKFVDLTGNVAPGDGGIAQLIQTRAGWYRISLALGIDDAAGQFSGPVAVDVNFYSLAKKPLGDTSFQLDRGQGDSAYDGHWKLFTREIFLNDDRTPGEKGLEKAHEELRHLANKPPDRCYTMIKITAKNIQDQRQGFPASQYVGLDSVSVQRTGSAIIDFILAPLLGLVRLIRPADWVVGRRHK